MKKHVIKGYLIILFVMLLPIFCSLIGFLLAYLLGCQDVSGSASCQFIGIELGGLIGSLIFMHLFAFYTIPFGIILLIG